jgi:DNA-directed RNA polymerase
MPTWDRSNADDDRDRIVYLAQLIWEAIDETVVKGKAAMSWLSKLARTYSKASNKKVYATPYEGRMEWSTPDGFPVVHYREERKKSQVDTYLDGRVQLTVWEDAGRLETGEMALALPPNFVHSLDATHLRMTINNALGKGIKSFGMVHDSFGVHAKLMTEFLNQCVKPAFLEMYGEHDPIQEFYDKYKDLVEDCPLPPSKGSLSLDGVLSSEFFFS